MDEATAVLMRRALLGVRPVDVVTVRAWVRAVMGVKVPKGRRCEGHEGPGEYLGHVFFEDERDVVVWANRGGGKTFYGAVATLMDLVLKPGIEVRILGGSLEQSERMYRHLRSMLEKPGLREMVEGRVTERGVRLRNGSGVELLSQSERSVRGSRVQRLRCDEVELFDREVWEAAQFVTRGAVCGGEAVRGSVEAMSTMHRPYGLMSELVEGAGGETGRRVIRWCAVDVMGRCGERFECDVCRLLGVCGRRAKRWEGFLAVEDVLAQARRSGQGRFESEMLCRRPSRSDAVYERFDPAEHVREVEVARGLRWVGGMDFGMRNPFVMLWAQVRGGGDGGEGRGVVEVVDEYVSSGRTVGEHLSVIGKREWPAVAWVGVDPSGEQRSSQTGLSTLSVLRRAGWSVRARRETVESGLERVRARLERGWGGRPEEVGLVIHPRCERLIESMRCYHFDAERPWRKEPVKDGFDHAADALRYLVVNLDGGGGKVVVRSYF